MMMALKWSSRRSNPFITKFQHDLWTLTIKSITANMVRLAEVRKPATVAHGVRRSRRQPSDQSVHHAQAICSAARPRINLRFATVNARFLGFVLKQPREFHL